MANDHHLTRAEALLLCDAFNGIETNVMTAQQLRGEVEDALRLRHLEVKWRVGRGLLARLRTYDDARATDLLARIRAFWRAVDVGAGRNEALGQAGLA